MNWGNTLETRKSSVLSHFNKGINKFCNPWVFNNESDDKTYFMKVPIDLPIALNTAYNDLLVCCRIPLATYLYKPDIRDYKLKYNDILTDIFTEDERKTLLEIYKRQYGLFGTLHRMLTKVQKNQLKNIIKRVPTLSSTNDDGMYKTIAFLVMIILHDALFGTWMICLNEGVNIGIVADTLDHSYGVPMSIASVGESHCLP